MRIDLGAGSRENIRNTVENVEAFRSRKYMMQADDGEKVNLFQETGAGSSASVEISPEGLAKLNEKLAGIQNENPDMKIPNREEQLRLLQEAIKPAQKRHRIIPNIKTNDKLVKSLQGADEKAADAAYDIIDRNFLPHNVGDLTEKERKELILNGVEEARRLSETLDGEKAELFLEAMETIAKYGMNGEKDDQGNVTYDIRWGALVGAPDDYISSGELMKRIAPGEYGKYSSMMEEGFRTNDDRLLIKATRYMLDWELAANRNNQEAIERIRAEQIAWLKKIEDTELKI